MPRKKKRLIQESRWDKKKRRWNSDLRRKLSEVQKYEKRESYGEREMYYCKPSDELLVFLSACFMRVLCVMCLL